MFTHAYGKSIRKKLEIVLFFRYNQLHLFFSKKLERNQNAI